MWIKQVRKLQEKYKECDITTDTSNFFINVGDKDILIHNSPSLYYGTDPDGKFFVSTKAIFNKGENQKLGYGQRDIQTKWEGEIANILSSAYNTLKSTVKKPGLVMNGDMLFSSFDQKKKLVIDGQKVIGLQPNTILYAIPVDKKSDVYNINTLIYKQVIERMFSLNLLH